MSQKKRRRPVHLHVMVSEEELALIRERMAEMRLWDVLVEPARKIRIGNKLLRR